MKSNSFDKQRYYYKTDGLWETQNKSGNCEKEFNNKTGVLTITEPQWVSEYQAFVNGYMGAVGINAAIKVIIPV